MYFPGAVGSVTSRRLAASRGAQGGALRGLGGEGSQQTGKAPSEGGRGSRGRHSGPRRPALGAAVDESPAADESPAPEELARQPRRLRGHAFPGLAVLSGGPEPSGSSDSPRASAPAGDGARRTGRLPGPEETPLLPRRPDDALRAELPGEAAG